MYCHALFPDTVRAFGVRLQPLTLGHALLLQRLGNPFAGPRPDPGSVSYMDAMVAAYVCSLPIGKAARRVNSRLCRWWLQWTWLVRRRCIEKDVTAFIGWFEDQWRSPDFTPVRGESAATPRGAEWLHQLVVFVMRSASADHDAALRVPVAVAQYDFLCHEEREGTVRLVEKTDAELERLAMQSAAEARAIAE